MKSKLNGKMITWLAMFSALSAVGAIIKIPAIIGSVALDAFPALLAGAILGGGAGAVVGALGHLLSALVTGFPMGPMHALVAIEMAMLVWLFGTLYKKNRKLLAAGLFILGNTFAAPLPFLFLIGKAFYLGILPSLLIGSTINAVIAILAIPRIVMTMSHGVRREKIN